MAAFCDDSAAQGECVIFLQLAMLYLYETYNGIGAAALVMAEPVEDAPTLYANALSRYVRTRSEEALYQASLLSHQFVRDGLGPDDIIAIHAGAIEQAVQGLSIREQAHASTDAIQFLLDVMIAYGVNHRAFLDLRLREHERVTTEVVTRERSRADEAERAATERSDLMRLVSHEIRTPLAVIKGSLDLARRALSRGHMERLDHLAAQALDAVARLTRMTNDLFAASQGTASPPGLAPLNLRAAVEEAFSWTKLTLEKDVTLVLDNDGEPILVLGHLDSLASVFGNLLTNAVRYTATGGQVTVRCLTVGGTAAVEVTDTGIGMTPETVARIFDQFYRAPEALVLEPRGLGLGLALANQLVHAHRGQIIVDSALGAGSSFRVVLPLVAEGLTASVGGNSGAAGHTATDG